MLPWLLIILIPLSNPCPELAKWELDGFCSQLLTHTRIIATNVTERDVESMVEHGGGPGMYCDLVRILRKIDCTQPFTVSPRWRQGCQSSYRRWICSTLLSPIFPLPQCDSTCHQVIRNCPYMTPDRTQLDSNLLPLYQHPSQYGGHPSFYCPSDTEHSEVHFSSSGSKDHVTKCIIFNPLDLNFVYGDFPILELDLSQLNYTFCAEYSSGGDTSSDLGSETSDLFGGMVNVTHCCWTWGSSLPLRRTKLSSTLINKKDIELENCGVEYEENGEESVLLQCFVDVESSGGGRRVSWGGWVFIVGVGLSVSSFRG